MAGRSGKQDARGATRTPAPSALDDPDERTVHEGDHDDGLAFDDATEPPALDLPVARPARASAPRASSLGAAQIADVGDGESTRADPPLFDDATARQPAGPGEGGAIPVARPRSMRGKEPPGPATSVQIDAVIGDRVPAIVVRRSGPEPMDPASRVGRAIPVPSAVDLERMMGRPIGSPAPIPVDPASRRSLPALSDPVSHRALPALGESLPRRTPPDSVSNRSLPALGLLGNVPVQGAGAPSAPEVTQINAAAALGIAPEPALPPRSPAPADRAPPPPLASIDLTPLAAAVRPEVAASRAEAASRAPVPAAALVGHRRESRATTVAGVLLAAAVVMLVLVASRDRTRVSRSPAASIAQSLAVAPVSMPPGAAGIRLLTRPAGAWVVVDGVALGPAPLLLRRADPRARYTFEITAAGYRPWRGQLQLDDGKVALVRAPESAGASEVGADEDGPTLVIALDHE